MVNSTPKAPRRKEREEHDSDGHRVSGERFCTERCGDADQTYPTRHADEGLERPRGRETNPDGAARTSARAPPYRGRWWSRLRRPACRARGTGPTRISDTGRARYSARWRARARASRSWRLRPPERRILQQEQHDDRVRSHQDSVGAASPGDSGGSCMLNMGAGEKGCLYWWLSCSTRTRGTAINGRLSSSLSLHQGRS